jgi:hypothetical protein
VQALPEETVTHIQSAQCTAQKKSVIGAHNKWQNEDGAWEKVRGVAALEGGKKILWNRHWQNEDGAWEKVRGIAALKKKKGGGGGVRGNARRGPGKPWIGGGEKESTLAVPTLFE